MGPPSILARIKHVLGRALRETGQALDRTGIRGQTQATSQSSLMGEDHYIFQNQLSRHRNFMPLLCRGAPQLKKEEVAFIAPCSTLVGTVKIGKDSSIWYGAVLRADLCKNGISLSGTNDDGTQTDQLDTKQPLPAVENDTGKFGGGVIVIGEGTNIQDGCIVTANHGHAVIGNGVTVGHLAHIHSATVEDHCLIGMGSVLNVGCKVETKSFVAAGAVVGRGVVVKSGDLWVGNPARKLRDLSEEEKRKLFYQAEEYVKVAKNQKHVMELGGNVPDSLIDCVMVGTGDAITRGETTDSGCNKNNNSSHKV